MSDRPQPQRMTTPPAAGGATTSVAETVKNNHGIDLEKLFAFMWGHVTYLTPGDCVVTTTLFSKFDDVPIALVMSIFRSLTLRNANPKRIRKDKNGQMHMRVWGPETAAFMGYVPRHVKYFDSPYILGSAIHGKNQDLASALVSLGMVDLTQRHEGLSWVGLACEAGLPYLVQQLVENCNQGPGSLMTPSDSSRHSVMPLHLACEEGHTSVVRYVAERLAPEFEDFTSTKIPGHEESTLALAATAEDHPNSTDTFRTTGGLEVPMSALQQATSSSSRKKSNVRVDWTAESQNGTPLHYAAYKGHADIVSIIGQLRGINIDHKTKSGGLTALHCACAHRRVEVVKQLVRRFGADPNAVDDHGSTPLHYACRGGADADNKSRVEIIEFLSSRPNMDFSKVSLGATDGASGLTILHEAVMSRNADSIRAVLRCCCKPWTPVTFDRYFGEGTGQQGSSEARSLPTDKASNRQPTEDEDGKEGDNAQPSVVAYLDPNVPSRDYQETCLHKATQLGPVPCLEALCECPLVDLRAVIKPTGATCLHVVASATGNKAYAKTLLSHIKNRIRYELGLHQGQVSSTSTTTSASTAEGRVQEILYNDFLSVKQRFTHHIGGGALLEVSAPQPPATTTSVGPSEEEKDEATTATTEKTAGVAWDIKLGQADDEEKDKGETTTDDRKQDVFMTPSQMAKHFNYNGISLMLTPKGAAEV